MTDIEKLQNALVFHDYAARYMLDAVAALLEATDFDATPAERHKARDVAKRDLLTAYEALGQAQIMKRGGRMTETEELRGVLREFGVQYQACGDSFTIWKHDGKTATYAEYPEGGKLKAFVTPEQAIAATLGPQIVRCKDCKHFTHNKEFWIEPPKVPFPMIGATSDCCDFWADTECKVEPDGFCAWGERKEVDA